MVRVELCYQHDSCCLFMGVVICAIRGCSITFFVCVESGVCGMCYRVCTLSVCGMCMLGVRLWMFSYVCKLR